MKIRFQASMAAVAVALAALVAAPAADAKTLSYRVVLNAKSETPPNASKGTGMGTVTYDDVTKELSWNIKYSGLTGDATMAHFHGPAKPGVAAGVLVPIGPKGGVIISPIVGSTTLNDDQAKALMDGMMYFNVHTQANPAGEIRGQVIKAGGMKMKMPAKKTDAPKQ
jgi:hypothetical protein